MNQPRAQLILIALAVSGWAVALLCFSHAIHLERQAKAPLIEASTSSAPPPSPEAESAISTASPKPDSPNLSADSATPSHPPTTPHASATPYPRQPSSAEWQADRLLADLEQVMHLDESSRRNVRTALVRQQQEQYSRSIRFDDDLRRALGERGADLEQRMAEREHQLQRRQQEQERSALAHQLQLSPDQEEQVGAVLDRVDALLTPSRATTERLIDDAMQQHQAPTQDRTKLREAMAIIEQSQESLRLARKESLANELRTILTPEQYEAWVRQASED